MITLELSDQDWEDIAEELDDPEIDPQIDPRIRRKLMAIRMHGLGVPHGIIAATLNICKRRTNSGTGAGVKPVRSWLF